MNLVEESVTQDRSCMYSVDKCGEAVCRRPAGKSPETIVEVNKLSRERAKIGTERLIRRREPKVRYSASVISRYCTT